MLASTRVAEEAIADTAARLAETTTAVSVDSDTTQQAIAEKQWDIGARLTDGQRRVVETAATSGRQLELVLGVAGAGKTTALDALRASFEDSGHRVIGIATSGQAARTLGDSAARSSGRRTVRFFVMTPRHHGDIRAIAGSRASRPLAIWMIGAPIIYRCCGTLFEC